MHIYIHISIFISLSLYIYIYIYVYIYVYYLYIYIYIYSQQQFEMRGDRGRDIQTHTVFNNVYANVRPCIRFVFLRGNPDYGSPVANIVV